MSSIVNYPLWLRMCVLIHHTLTPPPFPGQGISLQTTVCVAMLTSGEGGCRSQYLW